MPRRTRQRLFQPMITAALGGVILPKLPHPVILHGKNSRDRMLPDGRQTRFGVSHDMASGILIPNGQKHRTNGLLQVIPNGQPLRGVRRLKAREPTILKERVDSKGQKIRAKNEDGKPTVYISLLPRVSSQAHIHLTSEAFLCFTNNHQPGWGCCL